MPDTIVTFEFCQHRAAECRALAVQPDLLPTAQVMLLHISETWSRIAQRLDDADTGVSPHALPA